MDRRSWGGLPHVQLEDVAVVGIVLATPFISALNAAVPFLGDPSDFLGGLISLLAVVGAIIAFLTRVPGETRFERAGEAAPDRVWMIGPFIGAVGFVGGDSLDRMGLPGGDVLIGVAFVAVFLSLLLTNRLPVVSRVLRRLLMAPFVLLSAAFFADLASSVARGFGGADTVAAVLGLNNLLLIAEILVILALAAVPFYLALIFVPRELADPGGSGRSWVIRFAVFYVSLVLAIALGGQLPVITA